MSEVWIWLAIGFLGQALFSCRFIVQWLVSERDGRLTSASRAERSG